MKKRAQTPDAHTYTALFRGFGQHAQYPQTLARALSIYHSMFAAGSPVQPSIIHTNAVLKVCAMAGDMDALFGVAAELSPRGKGSANHQTYTIILNAIRNQAWHARRDGGVPTTFQEKHEATNRTILQCRRLWEEMRDRWASGELRLDEETVCALGRVLLLSSTERDVDDILSLLELTMGIPRQVSSTGGPSRDRAPRDQEASDDPDPHGKHLVPPSEPPSGKNTSLQESSSNESHGGAQSLSMSPFAPLPQPVPKSFFAPPNRNTLSLALDACIRMRLPRAGQDYWGLLTSPEKYNVAPDSENYHMYLRLLRLKRASKLALEMVEEMRTGEIPMGGSRERGGLQVKTFRIALSCCVRDQMNRNALTHAAKLIRIMMDTFECPDAKVLHMYLTLALSQQPRDWRTLMSVIRGTELGVRNLRSLLAYDPHGRGKEDEGEVQQLVRTLIGAFDIVRDLAKEEMPQEDRVSIREQRFMLDAWLKRMNDREKAWEKARRQSARSVESSAPKNDRLLSDGRGVGEETQSGNGRKDDSVRPSATRPQSQSNGRPRAPASIPVKHRIAFPNAKSGENRFRKTHAQDRVEQDEKSWKHALRKEKRRERRAKEKEARSKRLGSTDVDEEAERSGEAIEAR